jgi:molybdenum cofactor biosynthesis protein B
MGAKDHKEKAETAGPARCVVVTVSDSKTRDTDESGKLALEILAKFGHTVLEHRIVPNKPKAIAKALQGDADLIVTIGGTGISRKDMTVEVVREHLEKELPGFGELFRELSRKEIGTAAIMSRAILGVAGKARLIVCTPGSPNAVRVALEGILMNELKHLLWELRRYG